MPNQPIMLKKMLEMGMHFGHQTRFWNPKMKRFIFGSRQKLHIIDLQQSLPLLEKAVDFVAKLAEKKGKVLFVGTKFAAQDVVKEEAIRCGMPYVNDRWLGGMLTNYKTIRMSIKRLKDLEAMLENKKLLAKMTKKEISHLIHEKDKLERSLGGIKAMGGLPDALFIIDVGQEKIAVKEARRLGIPIVGVVDTNNDPDGIDYMIPGNDDAKRAIRYYCQLVADTIIEHRGLLELAPGKGGSVAANAEKKESVAVKRVVKRKSSEAEQPASTKDAGEKSEPNAPHVAAESSATQTQSSDTETDAGTPDSRTDEDNN